MDIFTILGIAGFFIGLFNSYVLVARKYIKPEDVAGFLQLMVEVLQLIKSNPTNAQEIDKLINLIKQELSKYGTTS